VTDVVAWSKKRFPFRFNCSNVQQFKVRVRVIGVGCAMPSPA
jgi:hypothetical protein